MTGRWAFVARFIGAFILFYAAGSALVSQPLKVSDVLNFVATVLGCALFMPDRGEK